MMHSIPRLGSFASPMRRSSVTHARLRARRVLTMRADTMSPGSTPRRAGGIVAGQYEEILLDARIERADRTQGSRRFEHAHDGGDRAIDDMLDHGTALASATPMQAHIHAVPRHSLAHRARSQPVDALSGLDLGARIVHPHRSRQPRQSTRPRRPTPSALRTPTSTHAILSYSC